MVSRFGFVCHEENKGSASWRQRALVDAWELPANRVATLSVAPNVDTRVLRDLQDVVIY